MVMVTNDWDGFCSVTYCGPQDSRTPLPRVVIKMSQGQALCYEGQKFYG